MTTEIETLTQIHEHGAQVADDSLQVIPDDFPIGQYIPQGDFNIFRIFQVPENATLAKHSAQLAPGTTRGSRYCIKAEDLNKCRFFELPSPNPLQGPIIEFCGPVTVEHPEYGDQLWPPCVVVITYQRRCADEIKRIQD